MANKAKMFKIESIHSFANVYQNFSFEDPQLFNHQKQAVNLKDAWKKEVFGNTNPLVLELACGKGDYTLALARQCTQKNFVGVDIKGARIYTGAKTALEEKILNVAFARFRIEYITHFFAENEVDEIWITFPDPFPRKGSAKNRLTSNRFLSLYKQICKQGAKIHLKTDDLPLFHFTKESVEDFGGVIDYYRENIYAKPLDFEELAVKTFYEKQHLANGRTINYLCFRLG
jgi:tRNA (guanine-N7-)-methyltransferase